MSAGSFAHTLEANLADLSEHLGYQRIRPWRLSLFVTLGIFLLIAARNPSANRSLIAFTAWSSFAHALVMAIQAFQNASNRGGLLGAAATFVVIGGALIVLAPGKESVERESTAPVLTS